MMAAAAEDKRKQRERVSPNRPAQKVCLTIHLTLLFFIVKSLFINFLSDSFSPDCLQDRGLLRILCNL